MRKRRTGTTDDPIRIDPDSLSAADVRLILNYDPETGILTRTAIPYRLKAGQVAGKHDDHGYLRVSIGGKKLMAHRLAWLWLTGELPDLEIDHRNGVHDDNRWVNLRIATRAENSQNERKPRPNGTSGYLGVTFDKRTGRYLARIRIGYTRKHLGRYDTPDEAYTAYVTAKRKLHPFGTI